MYETRETRPIGGEKLQKLGKKMNEQNHRSTYMPLFIVVAEEEIPVGEEYAEDRVRKDPDCIDSEDLCEECKKNYEETGDYEEECDDCSDECFIWIKKDTVPQLHHGIFFTAEACDQYIQARSYAMRPKAHSYAISTHRSNEMCEVLEFLSMLGGAIHPNYKNR